MAATILHVLLTLILKKGMCLALSRQRDVPQTCRHLLKKTKQTMVMVFWFKNTHHHTKASITCNSLNNQQLNMFPSTFMGPTPLDLFIPLNQDSGPESVLPHLEPCWCSFEPFTQERMYTLEILSEFTRITEQYPVLVGTGLNSSAVPRNQFTE